MDKVQRNAYKLICLIADQDLVELQRAWTKEGAQMCAEDLVRAAAHGANDDIFRFVTKSCGSAAVEPNLAYIYHQDFGRLKWVLEWCDGAHDNSKLLRHSVAAPDCPMDLLEFLLLHCDPTSCGCEALENALVADNYAAAERLWPLSDGQQVIDRMDAHPEYDYSEAVAWGREKLSAEQSRRISECIAHPPTDTPKRKI